MATLYIVKILLNLGKTLKKNIKNPSFSFQVNEDDVSEEDDYPSEDEDIQGKVEDDYVFQWRRQYSK